MKTIKNIFSMLAVVFLLTFVPVSSFAQSADQKYKEGLTLMKKQDYHGAIKSFKASMNINKSAANKKRCNKEINKCNYEIAKGKDPKKRELTDNPVVQKKKLTLSAYTLTVPANPQSEFSVKVETLPESKDWTAIAEKSVSWVELSKSKDAKALDIKVLPAEKTIARRASIAVSYGQETRRINVIQNGQDVEIVPSTVFTKFKKKGGQTTINIACNSDTLYTSSFNWYIDKAPDWCNAENSKTNLVLNVVPIDKKDPLYKKGRTGDIVIRSQDKECLIRVDQK